ncbi:MAG: MBOAT family O-acyltransferase [Planctomycetota bacterium]
MQFTQVEFLLLFALLLLVVWRTGNRVVRNSLLLGFSYYFYAYWDWRFCGLLLMSTAIDFTVARAIAASPSASARRRWLILSLTANLGVLGFFKYFNFFVDSARPLVESLGMNAGTLEIVLPVGISFYTFQTLSYTMDVYRGRLKPTDSLLEFALFVSFFPQLVAGPIVRAAELLPQLSRMPEWSPRRFYGGFQTALRGLVKKVLIADRLGEMVDVVFAEPDMYSGGTVWLAVLAYAGQIYYDFSGYSDIAIGVAKMLGYRFPANFRHPYLAKSVSEFWRRWHMTLSRWLRDYVYISLGGNQRGPSRTYVNLMLTMLLGGLWHGAAWTFVVWGLLHGVALAIERAARGKIQIGVLGRILTLAVIVVGWIFFRCSSFEMCGQVLHRLTFPSGGLNWFPPLALAAIGLMVADHVAWSTRLRRAMRMRFDRWYSPIATAIMIWSLILYAPRSFQPFVYFQF